MTILNNKRVVGNKLVRKYCPMTACSLNDKNFLVGRGNEILIYDGNDPCSECSH